MDRTELIWHDIKLFAQQNIVTLLILGDKFSKGLGNQFLRQNYSDKLQKKHGTH